MNLRKVCILAITLASIFHISQGFSISKQNRLSGITIKADGPEFDADSTYNGFNDCIMSRNGEMFVIDMILPYDVLVDVGANVGDWSMNAFAKQPNIMACCFEPIPALQPILQANLLGKKVIFSQYALSNEPGKATFVYYPKQPHLSSLHRRSDEILHDMQPTYIPVDLERLDSFCKRYKISKANVIKIDVEGNEFNVLLGSQRLLEKRAVDVIQFEYASTYLDSNSSLKQIYDYLTYYGFTLYRITPWGLIEINHWRDSLENFVFCNYVALRNT